MSVFFKSFKREMGKNSGKWLSNVIFKDKHSTPIKIIREKKDVELNYKKQEYKEKIKFEEKLVELEKRKLSNNKSNSLVQRKDSVLERELSDDKNELFDFALNLITEVKSSSWNSEGSDDEQVLNEYLEAHYQKLRQVNTKLLFMNATKESDYIKIELRRIRYKRLVQKYWVYFAIVILLFFLYLKSSY